jgi:LysR family transcriptional regulator, glycine cleavage system transcriptional activator
MNFDPLPNVVSARRRATPPLAALQAFERAAVHLSFRTAAHDLALTPSAVSHQIRGLEDYFGVRLFAREGRSVTLTPDGERFLESVAAGLALLDTGSREMLRVRRGGPRGVRVSALPFFAHRVLLPLAGDFERRHPRTPLRIQVAHEFADVAGGTFDVALRLGRERSVGLKFEPLLRLGRVVLGSPSLARGITGADDLAGARLIHVTSAPTRWRDWLRGAGAPGLEPAGEVWVDSMSAAVDAARHGLGLVLAPDPLIRAHPAFGRDLVECIERDIGREETIYFVCRPENAREKDIAAFRSWLKAAVCRLFGDGVNAFGNSPLDTASGAAA